MARGIAFDDAIRFTQRDAIAFLIVLAINLLAGIGIGVVQASMPVAEAVVTYSILTVGDGLVSAIPALLLSVAGALLTTRSDTGVDLGTELRQQLFSQPTPLAASRVIVVTTPEVTSLVDSYASIKVLWSADAGKHVDLVVNKAISDDEASQAYEQIPRACQQFLGKRPGWLGPVYEDPSLGGAVRRQRALVDLYPGSRASRCYERIALQLSAQRGPVGPGFWQRLASFDQEETTH